ncbi:tetratricopeptide repeat protein [Flavobacterium sp. J27]|uniref:tetratricopeptide repeat protein n=1 Tax=Flavobacterium sp. J27 TaxID=2060419 RepID=UPI001030F564|nr:tetratricopeptide repeat protein [Flavobacterium sp. J27]
MLGRFLLLLLLTTSTLFSQNDWVETQLKNKKKGLDLAIKNKNNPDIALKMLELGTIYNQYGLYANALSYYQEALKHIQTNKKDTLFVQINNAIGKVNHAMHKYEQAQPFLLEALAIAKQIKYTKGQSLAFSLLGENAEKRGEYETALDFENKSLFLLNTKNDAKEVAVVHENIGSIYEDLEQFDKAYTYFNNAYQLLKGSQSRQEANVLNNLGDVYRKKGKVKTGIPFTNLSINLAKKLNDNHLLESGHKDLAKAYALLAEYEKAYEHKLIADDYNQKAVTNENKNLVNLLQADYKINQKENQIKILQEQNKVNKANQKTILILTLSLLFAVVVMYIYYQKKRKASLKIQNYKQQTLKAELEKKEIEEKNLQRDLELKTATLSRYSLHIAQKNKMLSELSTKLKNSMGRKNELLEVKIKEISNEIDFVLQQENEWEEFTVFFEEIHPDFIKKLSQVATESLSPAELKLGILLRLNLSSKEIAAILRVTPDSVRVARHRFRKKLPINSKAELITFLLEL